MCSSLLTWSMSWRHTSLSCKCAVHGGGRMHGTNMKEKSTYNFQYEETQVYLTRYYRGWRRSHSDLDFLFLNFEWQVTSVSPCIFVESGWRRWYSDYGGGRFWVRIPVGRKKFPPKLPALLPGPSSRQWDTRVLSTGLKRPGCEVNHHFYQVPRLSATALPVCFHGAYFTCIVGWGWVVGASQCGCQHLGGSVDSVSFRADNGGSRYIRNVCSHQRNYTSP